MGEKKSLSEIRRIEVCEALTNEKMAIIEAWQDILALESANQRAIFQAIKDKDLTLGLELITRDNKIKRLKSHVRHLFP